MNITRNRLMWFVLAIAVGLFIIISEARDPSNKAQRISPGTSLETVVQSLGKPIGQTEKEGMAIYYFRPNFFAAGPIKVGFDKKGQAVYLKIYEDSPPQWDLRKVIEGASKGDR